MVDRYSLNTGVKNPETKAKIEAAVRQRIANANIQTCSDFAKLAASSVQIFGSEVVNDTQKKAAYAEYSKQLLQEYYDLNHDGIVTVDEFAKKRRTRCFKSRRINCATVRL